MNLANYVEKVGVKFGTSGVRARVEELTDEVVYIYTTAFLTFLKKSYPNKIFKEIVIAGDLRNSTPHIKEVVKKAINDFGYTCLDAGYIPSPTLSFYAFNREIPAIMITGSHIPDDRNGIKYIKHDGELLKEDEPLILNQDLEIGNIADIPQKNEYDHELEKMVIQEYMSRYLQYFNDLDLSSLNLGVYGHSAVGKDILVNILEKLGAKVIKLGYSDKFIPVDTESIRKEDIELAKKWIKEYNLNTIVSTDGDSDRPLITDENGEWLRGDILGILVSKHLGIEAVAKPISCNTAVFNSGFKKVIDTKIGSPYVIKSIRELSKEFSKVAGYEANGGYLLGSSLSRDNMKLQKLETRDAFLPILVVLEKLTKGNQKILDQLNELPQRFTYSQKVDNYEKSKSLELISRIKANNSLLKDIGGEIKDINELDGLRITFKNNDILHIRPSGNAPELRIYTESDTISNAKKIHAITLSHL